MRKVWWGSCRWRGTCASLVGRMEGFSSLRIVGVVGHVVHRRSRRGGWERVNACVMPLERMYLALLACDYAHARRPGRESSGFLYRESRVAFHIDIIDISRISEHERTIIRASRCLPGTKLSVVFFLFFFIHGFKGPQNENHCWKLLRDYFSSRSYLAAWERLKYHKMKDTDVLLRHTLGERYT